LLGSPELSGLHEFCYRHLFFFKYFRNLHWFLWIAIIPLFILVVCELFFQILKWKDLKRDNRKFINLWIIITHLVFIGSVIYFGNTVLSTYVLAGVSLLFFLLYFNREQMKPAWVLFFIFMPVFLQVIEIYPYLNQNAPQRGNHIITKEESKGFRHYNLKFDQKGQREQGFSNIYYATHHYNQLIQNIRGTIFYKYLTYRFTAYDQTQYLSEEVLTFKHLQSAFDQNLNIAYVSNKAYERKEEGSNSRATAQNISNNDFVEVTSFKSDFVEFTTRFRRPVFLVYKDAFHQDWKAFIDGKDVKLARANYAFKGLWVPAGVHVVKLRYGSLRNNIINGSLIILAWVLFLYVLWDWVLSRTFKKNECH